MANSKLKRYTHATIGLLFVVVAAVGAVLPGIPTVGPLMLASFFLLKSSPALEKRLVRNRFFAKYLAYIDGTAPMTNRMRISSILMMWLSISISATISMLTGDIKFWLIGILVIAGLIGTVFIWRYRRSALPAPANNQRDSD
ncbi:YbaN family protein [Mariniblastus sp.]|nr:YbaN family protein [Mariniblastus sp.]MDB4473361.1 YbaN family protein [bacterium]MDA7902877.1 YbaN family protein [Mariniblastus sp.]MDA7925354.1 YbaN family protein [Mariniblastus sp.]MDB4481224.1 YbaN family protein [bacterium]